MKTDTSSSSSSVPINPLSVNQTSANCIVKMDDCGDESEESYEYTISMGNGSQLNVSSNIDGIRTVTVMNNGKVVSSTKIQDVVKNITVPQLTQSSHSVLPFQTIVSSPVLQSSSILPIYTTNPANNLSHFWNQQVTSNQCIHGQPIHRCNVCGKRCTHGISLELDCAQCNDMANQIDDADEAQREDAVMNADVLLQNDLNNNTEPIVQRGPISTYAALKQVFADREFVLIDTKFKGLFVKYEYTCKCGITGLFITVARLLEGLDKCPDCIKAKSERTRRETLLRRSTNSDNSSAPSIMPAPAVQDRIVGKKYIIRDWYHLGYQVGIWTEKGSFHCVHGTRHSNCGQCEGISMCVHGKRKVRCKTCKSAAINPITTESKQSSLSAFQNSQSYTIPPTSEGSSSAELQPSSTNSTAVIPLLNNSTSSTGKSRKPSIYKAKTPNVATIEWTVRMSSQSQTPEWFLWVLQHMGSIDAEQVEELDIWLEDNFHKCTRSNVLNQTHEQLINVQRPLPSLVQLGIKHVVTSTTALLFSSTTAFPFIPKGYREPKEKKLERKCLTDDEATKRKLVMPCGICSTEEVTMFICVSRANLINNRCSITGHSDECRNFDTFQCRRCGNELNSTRRTARRNVKGSKEHLASQLLNEQRKVQAETDPAYRKYVRAKNQKIGYRVRLARAQIRLDRYLELNLVQFQCYNPACRAIVPFCIEWDHDKEFMPDGVIKKDCASQMRTLEQFREETAKTRVSIITVILLQTEINTHFHY